MEKTTWTKLLKAWVKGKTNKANKLRHKLIQKSLRQKHG
jgi:hypothetical protein